jgi:hypothetical protein
MFNSPTICVDLLNACIKSKIKPVLMVCNVTTRWNSTAKLLRRALQLHDAINLLVISEQHNRLCSACLKCFQLMKAEWDLLDKLFPLLEVFIYFSFWCLVAFTHKSTITPTGFPHHDKANFTKQNPPATQSDPDNRHHQSSNRQPHCWCYNAPCCSHGGCPGAHNAR